MNAIEKILKLAEDQVGISEDSTGRVKYSDEYGVPKKPWCMMYLWWLFKHAGFENIFYDGKKVASCGTFLNWAKAKGYVVKNPQRGDIVIISFGKDKNGNRITSHCGIIRSASLLNVETNEGNTCEVGSQENGGHVMNRTRSKKLCMAYIRLPYPEEEKPIDKEVIHYTVKPGDSLWKIAKIYYGKGSMYPIIKEYNRLTTDKIKVGQTLHIPIGG